MLKKNRREISMLALVVTIIISIILNTAIVFASQIYNPITIYIPVSYQDKKDSAGILVMLSSQNGSPLPEMTEFHMSDKEDKSFELSFGEPGIYKYEITYNRNPAIREQVDLTYIAEIHVTDKDSMLFAEEIIYKQGEEGKSDKCTFLNVKRGGKPDPEESKTHNKTEKDKGNKKNNKPEADKNPVSNSDDTDRTNEKTGTSVSVHSVKTGDRTDFACFFILLSASIALVASLFFSRRHE